MVPALSDELKNEVYKLRYQVFCIDTKIFNSQHYPDGLEFDDFDQQAVHYLIRHRKSGDYAATTRLILPDANIPEKPFPLELYCEIHNVALMQDIDRKHLGEVSRFCVSKTFKNRKNEAHTLMGIDCEWQNYYTQNEQRTFPYISLALMACFVKSSYENDIHYLFASMEPSFLRVVSALGINLIKIGPLVDYHGRRWPVMIKITDLLDCVAEKNMDIWNLLTDKGCIWQTRPIEIPSKSVRSINLSG